MGNFLFKKHKNVKYIYIK